jgi:hypothetical protein
MSSSVEGTGSKALIGLAVALGLAYFIFSRKAQAQSKASAVAVCSGSGGGLSAELGAGVNSAVESLAGGAAGVFKSAAPGGVTAGLVPAGVVIFVADWLSKAAKMIPAAIKDIFSPNSSQVYNPRTGQVENKPISISMLQAPPSSSGD